MNHALQKGSRDLAATCSYTGSSAGYKSYKSDKIC
jgi:hypothetical protein